MFQTLRNIASSVFRKPAKKTFPPYRVYTRQFDRIVDADDLDSVLGKLNLAEALQHEQASEVFAKALADWRSEADTGIIEATSLIRSAMSEADLADLAVTILVDQSGSLNTINAVMPLAAACDIAESFLVDLGIKTEVLGFTTSSWRGGKTRILWMKNGLPRRPGRLCDLLHIVYRSFGEEESLPGGARYKPMLRPSLLKENVDGEAVEWAVDRISAVHARRKMIVIVSDGAPVDDSTLNDNDLSILHRHIQEVTHRVGNTDIELVGVGIAHDVSLYYKNAHKIASPDELPGGVIEVLKKVILDQHISEPQFGNPADKSDTTQ